MMLFNSVVAVQVFLLMWFPGYLLLMLFHLLNLRNMMLLSNSNTKNICESEELETLTVCAIKMLSRLNKCEPNGLACECCALRSMNRDCYGLCPHTASCNFLVVLYDDCETANDANARNLPFMKHDTHIAKLLANSRIPVEEKNTRFYGQIHLTHW